MKWSIQQLRKISNFPYDFQTEIDFSEYASNIDDILSMEKFIVEGKIYKVNDDTFRFVYNFKVNVNLQCALTLDPVPYYMDYTYDDVYSLIESEENFLIEKNTINLDEMVWTNFLLEKPINVTLPNAYEILKERGIVLDDTENLDDDDLNDIQYYSDGIEKDEN